MSVDLFEGLCQDAQEDSKHYQSYSRKHHYCCNSRTERVDKDDNRQGQQQDSSSCKPAGSPYSECVKFTCQPDEDETVIEHPESHHNRKKHKRDLRIDTKEDAEHHIKHTADDDIALHHKEIVACRGSNKLGRAHNKHKDSEQDAQHHIALKREKEHRNAEDDSKHSRNRENPPMTNSP